MNFYLHYLGDYDRDTKGLSLIEHGAYRVLLDHVYATEQMPPNEPAELYRIAGAMTPAERKAVDRVAERFFAINGDGRRHNKRADVEIARAKEKSAKAKTSAAASVKARFGDRTDSVQASGERTLNERQANQNQKPEEAKTSDAPHRKPPTTSQGLDCPAEKLIGLYHELLPDCTKLEKLTPARRALIRARWLDEAKPNRDKHRGYTVVEDGLAYWRRFFAWCAESQFLTGRAAGRNGGAPFVASLPWLLKAENFAKAIEGTYHR